MNPFKKLFEILKNKETSDSKPNEDDYTESRIAPKSYVPRQIQFYRLRREDDKYYITRKVPYKANSTFADETVEEVFEFAEANAGDSIIPVLYKLYSSQKTYAEIDFDAFSSYFSDAMKKCTDRADELGSDK